MEHYIFIGPERYDEMLDWCYETFGKSNERITWNFLANNDIGGEVSFKKETDAAAFKLRWV